jgi:hypothetical protein
VFLLTVAQEELMPTDTPTPSTPRRQPRVRRALAIAAGVAMVPALYAVATAATDGGSTPSTVGAARQGADDGRTETEIEHGVVVEKPHGGATTPSVPETTSPSTPDVTAPTIPDVTTPTTPDVTTPTTPEPGDDNGNHGGGVTSVPSGTQSFSSVGGAIVVAVNGSSLTLVASSPAVGFGAEVHDNGPNRVEVRFSNGGREWRIRVELGSAGLTSEVSEHG